MNDLEEQRDFLLRSLEDLEREHEAGDVDEHDYRTLKDDYTARAAGVLRAIEQGASPRRRTGGHRGRRTVLAVGGVLLFAIVAGVLVAQTAGRRDAGEQATGDIRQSLTEKLNEAGRLGSEGDYEGGIAVYDEVLADDPNNAEALTYKGWYLVRSGAAADGLSQLIDAATANPEYPDAHAFLAVVLAQGGLELEALRELERLDALDPPKVIRDLVAPLRERLTSATTTTTGG